MSVDLSQVRGRRKLPPVGVTNNITGATPAGVPIVASSPRTGLGRFCPTSNRGVAPRAANAIGEILFRLVALSSRLADGGRPQHLRSCEERQCDPSVRRVCFRQSGDLLRDF
jgi:hypothetical protein